MLDEGLKRLIERELYEINTGDRWHTALLLQMACPTNERKIVLSEDIRILLRGYLAFRHHSRHAYAHHLQWERMQELVLSLSTTWDRVRLDINHFINDPSTEK